MEGSCYRFTSAEGGARLAMAAGEKNILVVEYRSFIATRLVHEDAYKIRGCLSEGRQRSVYVTRASLVPCVSYDLRIMTDLAVGAATSLGDVHDWSKEVEDKEVIVCTSSVLSQILKEEVLNMTNINVLIVDSCHLIWTDDNLRYIMKLYKECDKDKKPRILALTYPLFTSTKKETGDKENKEDTGEANVTDESKITNDKSKITIDDSKITNDESKITNDESKITNDESKITNDESKITNDESKITIDESKITNDESKITTDESNVTECAVEKEFIGEKITNTVNSLEVGIDENLDDYDMYEKLEWKIEELESELCCEMDLAEDIDGSKRLSASTAKPKELIIEYDAAPAPGAMSDEYADLDSYMRLTVNEAMEFINEHRYDPTEIYGEDLYEEFKSIPDPSIEPKYIFKQFLYVLDQLGPYAADKAAFSLLAKVEKLKIKVPYERHFLLLCLCTTIFVKIRCYADLVFSKYESDWEKIKLFCTPKVLRFAEILQKFQPPDTQRNPVDVTAKMMRDLDKCDFETLGNKIEDRVNTFEANLKDLEDLVSGKNRVNGEEHKSESSLKCNSNSVKESLSESVDRISPDVESENKTDENCEIINSNDVRCDGKVEVSKFGFSRRSGGRNRGRGRSQRGNTTRSQQTQQNPDALCGIVFMKEALTAKIMFMLIVDMSRSHPALSYLCAQYCAVDTPADPGTEPKECQRQGKKQEEVLKKFRMHECNLLLATSALEEGIDLPRCNLVLRWDVPASYRSHGLCRARGRAMRAACALLCRHGDGHTHALVRNLATYRELDQIISRKCGCGIQHEPPDTEEAAADVYTLVIKPYTPQNSEKQAKTDGNSDKTIKEGTENSGNDIPDTNGINNDANMKLIYNNKSVDNTNELENDLKSLDLNDDDVKFNNDDFFNDNDDMRFNNDMNDNIVCNRCNNIKNSESVECTCVNIGTVEGRKVKSKVDNRRINGEAEIASVDLSTAIALVNRYCGKLPSDTFTRLAPQWWMEKVELPLRDSAGTRTAYICTLRLPLNCPVKYNIVGHPMPTRVLARRMVALQACRILHKSGELDNQLMPIGKENFKAAELESNLYTNLADAEVNDSARPGTTKRRQYYYKRTACVFTDCQPIVDSTDEEIEASTSQPRETPDSKTAGKKRNMLYAIVSKLWCALPERYNTRGRRLHAPQHASQAIGILMAREQSDELQIPAFPVYTRSGEVRVAVRLQPDADVRLSPRRAKLVQRFMRFVFAEVLRVRRRGMALQGAGATHNNYYIVPTTNTTREDGTPKVDIDWAFLELIYAHTEMQKNSEVEKPILWQDDEEQPTEKVEKAKSRDGKVKTLENPLLKPDEVFVFDPEKYREAVVTPWYRNQDQPQFFLVAEICWSLSPSSPFPSASHASFREYYRSKYGAALTQPQQPLLDVDHTSARLNLLTPRYVNRKGVALPVSSERTRRAKRDRLDQKQILVPELCRVHPFAAPLWFATVALPCVLYRINALLIADEIRRAVAIDVGLGIPNIDETTCPGFQWPPLDFGWSLAEVLSADSEKTEKKKEEDSGREEKEKGNEEEENHEKDEEQKTEECPKEKTINDILQEKENAESGFEIGTWSNDMASSIPDSSEYDEYMEPLPSNLTFCTSASGGTNWCDPIEKPKNQYNPSRTFSMADSDCSYMSSDFDTDDSDLNSESDDDTESSGFWSKGSMGVRIEYKTAHEAEAVDVERKKVNPAPQPDEEDDELDRAVHYRCIREGQAPKEYIEKFRSSVTEHEKEIYQNGSLITKDKPVSEILPETKDHRAHTQLSIDNAVLDQLFPYHDGDLKISDGQITLESIEVNKRVVLNKLKKQLSSEEIKKLNCFSMVDVDIDSPDYINEKVVNVGFDSKENYVGDYGCGAKEYKPYFQDGRARGKCFDFDYQPPLDGHPGPSPSVILQALTMSNANDGINLERLETIGDSFLKFAITAYLYCAHPTVHEGKLSHMRSKQVSNLNLYRLGRSRRLGARMVASKFEPHDNWLPPCHRPPVAKAVAEEDEKQEPNAAKYDGPVDSSGCFIPYNLITQHSIPDKSIADCVEALIGAYLLECGPRGALLFMSWLGIRVLPRHDIPLDVGNDQKPESCHLTRRVGSLKPRKENNQWVQTVFGELKAPPSPLLRYIEDPEGELEQMLSGYDALERTLQYRFKDRSLLLQALTHASHQKNRLSDCYQRLEFLGDAVLDYLITRHLYEDPRRHSPGALTDLRSALVNNTIFATLAARHGFHKYFRHMSPGLNEVLTRYVKIQEENGHSISEEHYLIQEDEMEQAEDVEVPKALGDLFESVAGAIFLDSGMSLGAVWSSYVRLMGAELEAFSAAAPKSPVRELLEAEPDTAKFGKPERLADGRRVRVCVEVFGRGSFKGVGRNYRIAKGTAARCALRHLRIHKSR